MKGRLFAILAAVAALAGCETVDKYTFKRYDANSDYAKAWLSDQVLPAEINISGKWKCSAWGDAFLTQTDRDVNGYLGDYRIEGIVSGKKAYLLARDGGWYYYSIILEMPAPNLLLGYYSRSIPYKISSSQDIRLDRK